MLSESLRLLRVFHDLKQKELAKALDLSSSHLCEIENGNKTPSMDVINRYAQYFKVPISSIMFFSEQLSEDKGSDTDIAARNAIASKIIKFLKIIEERTSIENV